MKSSAQNLTSGSLWRQILVFSIPLMLSNLLQVLFNMSDIAVVGHFAGSMALGSVGSTTTLVTMFTGFLIGLSGGINVLTALYLGARNKKSTSDIVHSAAVISLTAGLLLFLAGFTFSRQILLLLNTKEELIEGAVLYIRIYFLGMPALAMYNFGNAVFSAAGDTRRPLLYLSIAGVLNVFLNLFFVIVWNMGAAGVGAASAISQYVSAFLIIRDLLASKDIFQLRLSSLRLHPSSARDILRIGIPCGLQNSIFAIANLFIQLGVNSFSAIMVAGNSAAANSDALIYDVMAAFYTACASFMSQNYGAKKPERVMKSYVVSLTYSFGAGILLGGLLILFGEPFLSLFTSDPEVIAAGMKRLTIMGFSYGVSAFMDCTIAASRALGKSVVPTIIVILGSCVFRVAWVYTIFAWYKTIPSLYLLYIFSWTITAAAEIIYFRRVYRKTVSQMA
ncbi:MAG: MATE family efflux transporter [Lachnospiraceae bacterium]|nr:MATE family efflux transporter [Lachnospiraceae bacterium]